MYAVHIVLPLIPLLHFLPDVKAEVYWNFEVSNSVGTPLSVYLSPLHKIPSGRLILYQTLQSVLVHSWCWAWKSRSPMRQRRGLDRHPSH